MFHWWWSRPSVSQVNLPKLLFLNVKQSHQRVYVERWLQGSGIVWRIRQTEAQNLGMLLVMYSWR